MKLSIYEILLEASKIKNKNSRIEFLRKNDSHVLRNIIQYALDPRVVWLLPDNIEYKPNNLPNQEHILFNEIRKLYLFVEFNLSTETGNNKILGHQTLKQDKRELLFIEFLERLDKNDAELINMVRKKKLPFKNIDYVFIQETFPNLLESLEVNKIN